MSVIDDTPIGVAVLEVKGASDALPLALRPLLQLGLHKRSFSKFLVVYSHMTRQAFIKRMQQQLNSIFGTLTQGAGPQMSPLAFLMLMAVSLLSSLFIAYLYVHFYSNRATGSQVHRAFPLLGISVTAIFVTIQFSLPLSLGLLGALVHRSFPNADQGAGRDRLHHAGDRGFHCDGDVQAGICRNHFRGRARRALRAGIRTRLLEGSVRRNDRDFACRQRQIARPGRDHDAASQAGAEGKARECVAERS